MKVRHRFQPSALNPLEDRLVLSGAGVAHVPAQVVQVESTASRATARFEVHWMRRMVSHHGMAIQMARLALKNSSDPEVISLARGIIRAQTREIGQMQRWLSSWYGVRGVRPETMPDDRRMLRDLRSQRGAAFDQMFLGMMIEHHTSAISDAGDCLQNAVHPRLRQLCTNIVATQTAEVARMQAMLGQSSGMMSTGGGGGHDG